MGRGCRRSQGIFTAGGSRVRSRARSKVGQGLGDGKLGFLKREKTVPGVTHGVVPACLLFASRF